MAMKIVVKRYEFVFRGRMNCMVERRRDDPMERRFPFNILGAFAPRTSQAERIAIICHGGDEPR